MRPTAAPGQPSRKLPPGTARQTSRGACDTQLSHFITVAICRFTWPTGAIAASWPRMPCLLLPASLPAAACFTLRAASEKQNFTTSLSHARMTGRSCDHFPMQTSKCAGQIRQSYISPHPCCMHVPPAGPAYLRANINVTAFCTAAERAAEFIAAAACPRCCTHSGMYCLHGDFVTKPPALHKPMQQSLTAGLRDSAAAAKLTGRGNNSSSTAPSGA